ncbi:MAG: hypothetical protein UX86_C0015G0002 [Candidatus Amesbacteria bacterium GW2011_GWC1_47_15]|uniref:Uncharacterized protein n=3 Tax=Candidatus Amesiibacteriota TaxID=1752730 RepID=A0A0G1S3F1_9BACT|nr:MAG: hypothetical protein UX86_C0015G0002 [Candidatus Amesbacteria bacterium GW2011_GWC1_47_15]
MRNRFERLPSRAAKRPIVLTFHSSHYKIHSMAEKKDGKGPKFYSWNESATGQWSDEELIRLRDDNSSELAEALWSPGRAVQRFALFELVAHGNYQKAATVARELVKQHPICETSIREDCGPEMAKILLETNLLKLQR